MESLESRAGEQKENASYQKFTDWNNNGWQLVTVSREVNNYQSLKAKLINFKDFKIWNVKNCQLVGPSGNYYNISGNFGYGVVDKLDGMTSEFDGAFSEEYDIASNILDEIKSIDRKGRKNLLEMYLDKPNKK